MNTQERNTQPFFFFSGGWPTGLEGPSTRAVASTKEPQVQSCDLRLDRIGVVAHQKNGDSNLEVVRVVNMKVELFRKMDVFLKLFCFFFGGGS